ncbi:MAG: flavin reductase family protein [Chloroflexota bacterium]|nr:flavin reductase family protein [Chloroflexota bacterium]
MERKAVGYDYKLNETLALLADPGLLLASTKRSGESNVMTIGWGTVGIVWSKPVFIVLVRPSRYTYEFIEDSGVFTVNVPTEDLRGWVTICGTWSGRDIDKFSAYEMSTSPAKTVETVTIDACPLVYECEVVHYHDLVPAHLAPEIEVGSYGGSDYHRVYYGEIRGCFASRDY